MSERQKELAAEFCKVLREWLSAEEMAEVVKRNQAEEDKNICASHDFCDANEAMDEAFKRLTGASACETRTDTNEGDCKQASCMTDETLDLWNGAWSLAKQAEFKL